MAFHYIISGRSFLLLTFIICLCGYRVIAQNDPTNVQDLKSISVTETTIVLQWEVHSSFTTFNVTCTGGATTKQMNVTDNNCTIANLLPGVIYNITVYSVNSTYTSPGTTILVTTLPSIVRTFTVDSKTNQSVMLIWTFPNDSNPSTYTYTVDIINGSLNRNISHIQVNFLKVEDLLAGETYNFTIYTVTVNGIRSFNYPFIMATTMPNEPQNLAGNATGIAEIFIEWTPPGDVHASSYEYLVAWNNVNLTEEKGQNTTKDTHFNIQSLFPGNLYTITVTSVFRNISSIGAVKMLSTMPSIVSTFTVTSKTNQSVILNWMFPNDSYASTYTYTVEVFNGSLNRNISNIKDNFTKVEDLLAGETYNFTIYTITGYGIWSHQYPFIIATTMPNEPQNLAGNATGIAEIFIEWTPPGDVRASSYKYLVAWNNVNLTEDKGQNTTKDTHFYIKSLFPGNLYTITVTSVFRNTSSIGAVKMISTMPSIVRTFTVTSKTNQSVVLNWMFPNDSYASTYTYTVEVINGSLNRNISNIKDNFTKVEDLLAGETYNFTIYTINGYGIWSHEYQFIIATTMPNEPQNLAGNVTGIAEIFIEWIPPGDVHTSSYEYLVAWNNVNLTEDKGQNTTKDTHFIIKSLFPGNLYTITVTSVFRNTSSIHAVKHEQTNPVSTQNFTVLNTTNITATLQWDPPSYRNSKVNGYRVIVLKNENNVVYIKTTEVTDIVVDSLEPGYIYKFSVESYARNEIATKKRSLSQMDLTWTTYSTPKTTTGETVPDAVKEPKCSKVNGYQIKVEFKCPVGNYSQIRVFVNDKPSDNCSCTESNTISGLQPAQEYKVKIITLGTDKFADTEILKCYTDSTGVIVGSVFGILLFLLLIGLIVFFVLKKRRSKSNSEHIPISTKRKRFHTITKERFKQNYENKHANSDLGFAEEYQELSSVGTLQPKRAAELPENKAKNRFTNVLPYDHSRVKLTTVNDTATTDYINANFMPGYNSTKEFIASQGPLPNTTADFWRMVWEHHVNTIVMLTNCMENGRVKCERYWPLDYTPCTYGDITVTVTSDTILPEWTTRDFSVKHAKQPGVLYIRHFHFTAWPDHGVPDSTSSIIQFRNLVREHMDQRKSNGPTVVHCSAGVGRTGTLIALDYLIQQMEREHRIGTFAYVEKMRMNRGLMVQTEEQYIFLNKCMLDLIDQPSEENIYENQVPTDLIYENATVVRNFQSENA